MATAFPGSGPASSFGMSNKLQSKMNSFREMIEKKKLEVRKVSREMRSLIEYKEEAIIRVLDTIWKKVNAKMDKNTNIQTQVGVLETKAKEMEQIFKELKPRSGPLFDISEKLNSLKGEMDFDIPNVKLTWKTDELEDCINRMCRCDQQILVYNENTRFQLKWSKCEVGREDNQLYFPCGIATNPIDKNIYVADSGNNRVQIFSREGEWIRSVNDENIKSPENILFHKQSIYVQCNRSILKLNKSLEETENSNSFFYFIAGICTDDIHIYVGQHEGMNLIVLTLELFQQTRISLNTEFCKQDTRIRDISLSQELFYILLFKTEFPIQAFSRKGILTRCVVKKDSINSANCFCLDQQQNILVTDCGDSKVKIFSNEGELLTQVGERISEIGSSPAIFGICLSELRDIVTVQQIRGTMLKLFSRL